MKLESNPCIKCGKERIKEKEQIIILNSSKTKIITYVCPDKVCQKIVAKQIKEKEEKKLALIMRSKQRRNNRQTAQKEKSAKK